MAGGVDTVQGPFGYLCFSKTQALSPRGRCATSTADGDGIVISEGIAMVALKRLADAERDGDRIYAVIKGVGGSSDGNAKGLTAPLPAGQLRAMRRAYAQAGFGPATVGLFEAHGTGHGGGRHRRAAKAPRELLGGRRRTRISRAIGSVKTMIGHTKATAGVAGLIKAALGAASQGAAAACDVDAVPNHVLRAEDSPLLSARRGAAWLASPDGAPRRAAVSAFGFGGTNFHVVMEEYAEEYRDWLRGSAMRDWPAELLLWSAPDRAALKDALAETRAQLAGLDGVELRRRRRQSRAALAARRGNARDRRDGHDRAGRRHRLRDRVSGWRAQEPAAGCHRMARETACAASSRCCSLARARNITGMLREEALHLPTCADTLAQADRALGAIVPRTLWRGHAAEPLHFPARRLRRCRTRASRASR